MNQAASYKFDLMFDGHSEDERMTMLSSVVGDIILYLEVQKGGAGVREG